jgi:hypothetical protein
MLSRPFFGALFVGLTATVALVGCATETADDELGSASSELTAQVLGNIGNGETKTGSYSGAPENRAYAFRATGNDTIVADVGITNGDAIAFLTDANFNVLAQADNGGPGRDARVTMTIPPGPSRAMRIAFRNNDAPSGNFKVRVTVRAGQCTGQEPWFDYQAKPADCEGIHISCPAGQVQFSNACGCGCERP